MTTVQSRVRHPETLTPHDATVILTRGRKLFSKLKLTPEAKILLADDDELREAIQKW